MNWGDCSYKPQRLRLGSAACLCLLVLALSATANPVGGAIVSGNARISSRGSTSTITQTSSTAIINWQDFSIGPNQTTQFLQPNSSSITLNRIIGGNPSQILGSLQANGNVYIINPNGILFGKSAQVNVGGLLATTSQISNQEFLNGSSQKLFTPGSNPNASITNEGTITVRNAGLVALVAPNVVNQGIIQANMGKISLGSADHFILDLYGDNLITLDAGTIKANASLINAGVLKANGGSIQLSAQAADQMLHNVVNMSGYIQAETVDNQAGKVILLGGNNSILNISGTIDVSGVNPGQNGGLVQANASTVNLLQGGLINASSMQNGNGGTISLWADQNLNAYGTLLARGGSAGGNGGSIETSSHLNVDTAGITVDASAAHGAAGTWLTDPITLTITDALAASYNASLAGGTNVTLTTSDGVEFDNTLTNISWNTAANFSLRSNNAANTIAGDPNTITYNGGCTPGVSCQVISSGSGNIDFYYNPTSYATPTDFTPYVQHTGSGVFTPWMEINTAAELGNVSTNLTDDYAVNTNISVGAFSSLATFSGKFTGNIQGNQYTLSNITINTPALTNVGLFGDVSGGTLENITVSNVDINGKNAVGGIAGLVTGSTLIGSFNVLGTSSTVTNGGQDAGGVFGAIINTPVDVNMTNYATVTGQQNIGGVIGRYRTLTNQTVSGNLNDYGSVSGSVFNVGGDIGTNVGGIITANMTVGNGINPVTIGGNAQAIGYVIGNQNTAGADLQSLSVQVASNVSFTGSGSGYGGIFGALGGGANFTGLDLSGANYSIPAVYIPTRNDVGGLIGIFYDGTTLNSNLHPLSNVTGHTNVGGIIGFSINELSEANSTINGTLSNTGYTVTGFNNVGGLIGLTTEINLNGNMTSNTTVTGTGTGAGGLIGYVSNVGSVMGSGLSMSTTGGSVSGVTDVGGLIGIVQPTTYASVNPFSNYATVTGTTTVGGVFGDTEVSTSNPLYNHASVTGNSQVGGIAGLIGATGSLSNALDLSGSITGTSDVGGIAGLNQGNLMLSSVNAGVTISGSSEVGGIVGYNSGLVQNVSFGGTVSASAPTDLGGIAGYNSGTVQYALGVGPVNGSGGNVGQLVGSNVLGGVLENSLYTTSINQFSSTSGTGLNAGTITSVTGANDVTLANFSTYTGLGFSPSIWQQVLGYYASLSWCGSSCLIPEYFPPISPSTYKIIQTQIVIGELSLVPSVTYLIDTGSYLASTGLNIVPGSSVLSQMNLDPNSPDYGAVTWFMNNTTVLQWLDPTAITQDPNTYAVQAIQGAVGAQQTVMGCPVK